MPKPVCFAEPPSPHSLATPLGPSFGPLEASVPGDFVPSVPADLADRLIRLHGDPIVWWVAQGPVV